MVKIGDKEYRTVVSGSAVPSVESVFVDNAAEEEEEKKKAEATLEKAAEENAPEREAAKTNAETVLEPAQEQAVQMTGAPEPASTERPKFEVQQPANMQTATTAVIPPQQSETDEQFNRYMGYLAEKNRRDALATQAKQNGNPPVQVNTQVEPLLPEQQQTSDEQPEETEEMMPEYLAEEGLGADSLVIDMPSLSGFEPPQLTDIEPGLTLYPSTLIPPPIEPNPELVLGMDTPFTWDAAVKMMA